MEINKLRSIIKEAVNAYDLKEIEATAENAAMEAKLEAYDKAIKQCEGKIHSAENIEEIKDLMDAGKVNELKKHLKNLQKSKEKLEKLQEKKNKNRKVVTDEPVDEPAVEEGSGPGSTNYNSGDDAANINYEEGGDPDFNEYDDTINESFLKMQKLAGVITEAQYNSKKRLIENYTPPAYEAINDLMDIINMNTGTKGRIVPYRSISWLPSVSDADGDMDMLVYKKGKYEIAIGADDVYQSTDDEDSNIWIIQSNDPNVDFEEHMTFNEAENAASEWLKS